MTHNQTHAALHLLRSIAQGSDVYSLRMRAREFVNTLSAKDRAKAEVALTSEMLAVTKNKWRRAKLDRHPHYQSSVEANVSRWLREAEKWELLASNGERVMPLLLVGESGSGKTSMLSLITERVGLPAWTAMGADVIASHLGETGGNLRAAFKEVDRGVFLLDEFESIAGNRAVDGAAGKEMSSALTVLLDCLDNIPPGAVMVFATNRVDMVDPAILRRVALCVLPTWNGLSVVDRNAFATSHGGVGTFISYADCVQDCRRQRIDRLLGVEQ